MDHFAGLDVSVKDASLCILDDAGLIGFWVTTPALPNSRFHQRRDVRRDRGS
jgi:hypothetical protein